LLWRCQNGNYLWCPYSGGVQLAVAREQFMT
jgi:hypothetical protein